MPVSKDRKGFVLEPSGRPFVPWGFDYDHDDTGRLRERTGLEILASTRRRKQAKKRCDMKILQVLPKAGVATKLKTLLKTTERQLRGPHTTFERVQEGRWKHVKYPGWIQWDDAPGGLLIAEVRTKVKDHEWQILEAFIGYLDRHLGEHIESISIYYR